VAKDVIIREIGNPTGRPGYGRGSAGRRLLSVKTGVFPPGSEAAFIQLVCCGGEFFVAALSVHMPLEDALQIVIQMHVFNSKVGDCSD
jgi:hypothetical protein